MSIIKSSADHLTLEADGVGKDVKFNCNGVEKASISSAGAFTSTTIDATKLTGNLPAISGASLTNLPGGGKVLQVVSMSTQTETSTTSTSFAASNVTLSITPSATTSKILVLFSSTMYISTNGFGAVSIYRDATNLGNSGDGQAYAKDWTTQHASPISIQTLDSPATTSAVTYTARFRAQESGHTAYLQYTQAEGSITLMEIGA